MRAKKNEPLSNLKARIMRVVEKGTSVTPATLATLGMETMRTASLATSVEEIIPLRSKKRRTRDKLNDKADSRSSSIWDDSGVALARA